MSVAEARSAVLLTGFGPFPGVADNPSAHLVTLMRERARALWPQLTVASAVLRTEWHSAIVDLDRLLEQTQPRIAVQFGVSARAKGLTLETLAYNHRARRLDACGVFPTMAHVVAGGPARLEAGELIAELAEVLARRGHDVVLSRDPGRYLCNAVFYHGLLKSRRDGADRLVSFIHIPPGPPEPLLPAAMTVLEALLARSDRPA